MTITRTVTVNRPCVTRAVTVTGRDRPGVAAGDSDRPWTRTVTVRYPALVVLGPAVRRATTRRVHQQIEVILLLYFLLFQAVISNYFFKQMDYYTYDFISIIFIIFSALIILIIANIVSLSRCFYFPLS
jgi:heme/copper-type cytochrome/quinol oxidase subunit 4